MKGTAWIGLAALFLLALASKGQALEMFSSIGKYDYGEGGVLLPGTEITLLDQAGPGAITLFQFASEYDLYEETIFRFYYDGESVPHTSAKLFKGMWHSDEPRLGSNGKGSFYLSVPIPLSTHLRITAEMSEESETPQLAYWTIRGVQGSSAEIGAMTLPDRARLRLYELEEEIAYPLEYVTIAQHEADATAGLLYATQLHFKSASFDYLEGRVRFASNGNVQYLATGIDDYFGSAWWFTAGRGTYTQTGATSLLKIKDPGEIVAHRFHERDLVPWKNSFQLSIRNGDQSMQGATLGEPDITQIRARVWVYEWPTLQKDEL